MAILLVYLEIVQTFQGTRPEPKKIQLLAIKMTLKNAENGFIKKDEWHVQIMNE